uniref:Uncharacterized protein n=1 Tax=Helicotheca tamesis TaxID=374047 RepID=A0A7S2N178_9STRA|eukprot:CAMPEP_0185737646 /NCGR_PEP_ID=MMETSP1171-20130828/30885_1 /TAXON_ID=374046 /ORGANISM="Helicotheca tamensis, Strain CCMP826" /LENGTH=139 /DNA_ID=CAMNT_0028408613 /DNA_START=13 /DNA_END=432 /DNA_ORIENTATION=+
MIIPITRPTVTDSDEDDTPQEWSLLELNGELIPPAEIPQSEPPSSTTDMDVDCGSTTTARMELGAVRFSDDGTPMMTIGSHELKGKIVNLKQPFVIMKKNKATKRKRCEDCDSSNVNFEVAGVITKKMLFDQYPKTIMR